MLMICPASSQGDSIGIYDVDGAIKAWYTYDAWGNVLTAVGELAEVNPIRYRGYYYDTETDYYYCQSRYYNPEWCRWINADALMDTSVGILGTNMYAYCNNDPINFKDSTGYALEGVLQPGGQWKELWEAAKLAGGDFLNLNKEWALYDGPLPVGDILLIGGTALSAIVGGVAIYQAASYLKSVNLPAYKKLTINWDEIISGHTPDGGRGGPQKDRFPDWAGPLIAKIIQEAYNNGDKIKSQTDSNDVTRVFIRGFSETLGGNVEMWVNITEKILETAWPKF